jgi:ABC-type sugar transport system ATPase subunit
MTTTNAAVFEARGVGKSFPGVRALDGVDVACRAGRVHALLGENGAGKSTLVRIMTGSMQPDDGELLLEGRPVVFSDPRDASAHGVAAVYQELTVLPAMSVADNVMLGQERTRRGFLQRRSQTSLVLEALERVGLGHLNPSMPAERLSLASQQLVEIARVCMRKKRLLILDEPSAVLAGEELARLFAIIRSVTEDGVAVVYISHRISEIRDLADDITVLRDGRVVSTGTSSEYDTGRIVGEMVGRDVDTVFPQQTSTIGDVVLRVSDTRTDTSDSGQIRTSLELRAGEIVGIAGLLGSGRSRLLRSIAGVAPQGSHVWVNGKLVGKGIRAAIQAGLVLVPEERKTEGLVLNMSVKANVTLADLGDVSTHGILFRSRENAVYEEEKQRLNIRATSGDQKTDELSGGNQQKVVLAKWLRRRPRVLLLDEPTRGIDVGTRAEIYRLIAAFAAQGLVVLFASSDLPEIVGLSRRVLVCRGGNIVGVLEGPEIDEEHIMHLALGTEDVQP